MGNVSDFYNSLFTIEFTLLTILLAGVFLLLQIIHESRLYKFLKRISWLKLAMIAVLPLLSLVISALAALLSSFPHHNIIPASDFDLQRHISNPWFALSTLILLFVSAIIIISVAINEILSLRPVGLVKRASGNIKGKDLRRYLIKRYGLHEPLLLRVAIHLPERESEQGQTVEEEEKTYQEDMELYSRLMEEARDEDESDPLEPIGELAIRAIRDRDSSSFAALLKAMNKVFSKDMNVDERSRSRWDANSQLFKNLVDYLLTQVDRFLERGI